MQEWFGVTVETVRANSVEFDIYFKSMSYSTFTQSKKIEESSLLSDIGNRGPAMSHDIILIPNYDVKHLNKLLALVLAHI